MATDDFFRARLDHMIDLLHPLALLARRMPRPAIEASLAPVFAHRDRKGRQVDGADLVGPSVAVAGAGVSNAGRPRLPIWLMVALLYLKHAYNESDEFPGERWAQDVYFQFFSGQDYFEPRLPCDSAQISRFRRVLGEAGVEPLQKTTTEAAVDIGAVKKTAFERVIVDTTVQQKAIAYPTDSRLLAVAVSHQHGLMVGTRSFPGNPYDGHTLAAQIEQTNNLLQNIGAKPTTAIGDLGYRGVDKDLAPMEVIHRGKFKSLTPKQKTWLRRRQAIEPLIGHTKADHRMDRCWLKGAEEDALHAVLCAAGFNIRWLLLAIVRLGLGALLFVFTAVEMWVGIRARTVARPPMIGSAA